MLVYHLALVSQVASVTLPDLTRVSAALQKQLLRDAAPIWDLQATVDPFATLEDVPVGYWSIIVTDGGLGSAAGIHADRMGQPYALVEVSDSWSLAASHEAIEMVVDPFGRRMIAGPSPMGTQGRVSFLVEVCDPCEAAQFGYTVNDVLVSDFYSPQFFDPTPSGQARYSFTGAITAPRQVLNGGYLSWLDPESGSWYQRTMFDNNPADRLLGEIRDDGRSFREQVNRLTPQHLEATRLPRSHDVLRAAQGRQERSRIASAQTAKRLREDIERVRASLKP
jgi:hypothetical protein